MQHFPIFARLDGRSCLVVGGGEVGARKVRLLLAAGANVTVVAPALDDELRRWLAEGRIRHVEAGWSATGRRADEPDRADANEQTPTADTDRAAADPGDEPDRDANDDGADRGTAPNRADESGSDAAARRDDIDLRPYWLIVAATSDREVNAAVAAAAESAGRFCNVVDDPELGSAIMPAIVDRAPVTVAVSTGGRSPVLARWAKGRIESMLPLELGQAAQRFGDWRGKVRERVADIDQRRRFWEWVLERWGPETLRAGRGPEPPPAVDALLDEWRRRHAAKTGEAYLVGAGPGRADLITLRGRQLLSRAEVVLYDRLVGSEVLEFARRDAERISVAKTPGQPSIRQPDINALLIRRVRAGQRVCRLKGGDPMIFGRGGEEIEALAAAGLPFEVVPGVSAAQGCACYAGIPLTLRGAAQSVVFATGHTERGIAEVTAFVPGQTLVFYMGVARYSMLAERLIQRGYDGQTPVAVVERGTADDQRVISTVLEHLGDAAEIHGVASPALLFVGETSRFARAHGWFAPHRLVIHPQSRRRAC